MDNDYDITAKIEKDILEWIVENYSNIETVTPRMILKLLDIRKSEPDRWREMANIKFGV